MNLSCLARWVYPGAITLALLAALVAAPAVAATTSSWNGYRWARTGPLAIKAVSRLSSTWQPYFAPALRAWSTASQIDFVSVRGSVTSACSPVFGTVQVCNGNYGTNGWLGYANVWLSGGFIVQATVRLNDTYFTQASYNKPAFRTQTICQELGHTIGLAHNNTSRSDRNTGSCMDYSNDPDGGSVYGASNLAPGKVDFDGLNIIYRQLNNTQLASTKLTIGGDGLYIDGWNHPGEHAQSILAGVPEPDAWVMLIAGFGLIGAGLRRRRSGICSPPPV